MSADVETIVIGAGVVGLAIARALAVQGQEVLVLEQHGVIGAETSSRNSEVIHAGIYYPPGSLRARLCVQGKLQLYRLCAENGIPHKRCEKLLVATAEDQLPKLKAIQDTAVANDVSDLKYLSGDEAQRLEPELRCVAALLSPSTGIIDSHALMLALQGHAEAHGGQVVLNSRVSELRGVAPRLFALDIAGDHATTITCRNLVLAAGLHASELARTLSYPSSYQPPETYYAKGQYYALSARSPFTRHVYPMPQGAWLGLHATVDLSGRCKFGPDIEWIPTIDYSFEPAKLQRSVGFIRSYYPGMEPERLHADYTGIRPKLYRQGEPVPDFAFHTERKHGLPGLVMLFGIESPGLTAALAIGDYVATLLRAPA
ncbi:MAG TPA: NAD(P)/FAD-dependent oxidoreductase [Hyphomicrobiaceae bacterium]|nr:NAD(P)/FAD-dependent oxidoreductase [Hyphomicrobiaceae bacterium]